jgi:toxin YoeB
MSKITFTDTGFYQYTEWLSIDKKLLVKINSLLKSIERDGALNGIGKPEKLKYKKGYYSRRIDEGNRLVYTVNADTIIVLSCKGHYEE